MDNYTASSTAPWHSVCRTLTEVRFVGSVTHIGSYAFDGCTSLVSLDLPSSVESIGDAAFRSCTSLELFSGDYAGISGSLLLSSDGKEVVAFAAGSSDSFVNIPRSVEGLRPYAFYGCASVTSLSIPIHVKTIGESAFYGCKNLKTVYNLSSLDIRKDSSHGYVGYYADKVYGPSYLGEVSVGKDMYYVLGDNGSYTVVSAFPGSDEVSLPSSFLFKGVSVKTYSVGQYAFAGNTDVTSVSIPSSVLSLGDHAFYGCTGLSSVSYGRGLLSIGSYTFYGCTAISSLTLPASLLTVGAYAFYGCTSVSEVYIPPSVTNIGEHAFEGCAGLIEITFGNRTQSLSIGESSFKGCSGLQTVSLPSSVTLGANTFEGCSELNLVSMGPSSKMGDSAFKGCTHLEKLSVYDDMAVPDHVFEGCTSLAEVRILASGGGKARVVFGIDSFKDAGEKGLTFVLYNVVSIDNYVKGAEYVCLNGSSVSNGTGITTITPAEPDKVTGRVDGLVYHFDRDSLIAIVGALSSTADESAGSTNTSGCTAKKVKIPDYIWKDDELYLVVGFDRLAFYKNDTIEEIEFNRFIGVGEDSGTPGIWDCTFRETKRLNTFRLPDSGPVLGHYQVYGGALYGIDFDYTVKVDDLPDTNYKGTRLIKAPSNAVRFEVEGSATIIERYAFSGSPIESVVLNNVQVIGSHAFYNCTSLTSVTGSKVTVLEDSAFENCISLTGFGFTNVQYIGTDAFYGTGLKTVKMNLSGIQYVGCGAFSHCLALERFDYSGSNDGEYLVVDGVLLKKDRAHGTYSIWQYPACKSEKKVDLRTSPWSAYDITEIAPYSFYGTRALSEFVMSDNVVYVGREAFAECPSLCSVHIGKSYYGSKDMYTYNMFGNDRALTTIDVDPENPYFCNDSNGILFSKDLSVLYCYPAG
ncbi:MAG: leucine-rich repeat domain-containing protein, partial [archaeon]|nr:leucine-rich repeat domain-containing protein [archaeon]